MSALLATCHCGAIEIAVDVAPTEVTECNCSLCRRYGVVWAYFEADQLTLPDASLTATYAWNGRHVDFHRCRTCGCVTHWTPRADGRTRRGLNARLLPPEVMAAARLRHKDGAGSGAYLD
ncbi:MAG: GFA family protein [Luteimonas sp.]